MARPIAASAAATVKINRVNICPFKSFKNIEKDTIFIFTASNKSSIDIKITIKFFLFNKIEKLQYGAFHFRRDHIAFRNIITLKVGDKSPYFLYQSTTSTNANRPARPFSPICPMSFPIPPMTPK